MYSITKNYPNKKILTEPFTYTFIPGEKIGVVGKNGVGKTTLLNIIQGKEAVDSGRVSLGDTIVFGYYSQGGMVINNDKRIIEIIKDIAEHIPLANGSSLSASQLLTRFNFSPAVQFSYAHTLSGGEKRRLYLCTVLMKNPNFLILDEPTNDLDILTLQTLEDFLEEFKGCVLIVSHDRYFIDRLVDHTFVLEGDGAIKDYPGNYTEYRNWKQEHGNEKIPVLEVPEETITVEKKKEEKAESVVNKPASKKLPYKLQKELDDLNKRIPELESRKKELEEKLAAMSNDYSQIQKLTIEFQKVSDELDAGSMRWLEISEEV
jgi:ATP-binding cassette subfamily F protein uup